MDEEKKAEDENPEPNFATQLHESIKRMSKVEETVGDLICTLQDLPLVVPRYGGAKNQREILGGFLQEQGRLSGRTEAARLDLQLQDQLQEHREGLPAASERRRKASVDRRPI
jgi:hypothetical protein